MRLRTAWLIACFGGLINWLALALQLQLLIEEQASQGGSSGAAVWRFVGFFTILTNIATAFMFTEVAIVSGHATSVRSPRREFAVTTAIAIVGIVYALFLQALWNPQGWQKAADVALHTIVPILFVAMFVLRSPHGLRWSDGFYALIFPLAYCAYVFARGAFDNWYPYYFIDPNKLSNAQLAVNIVALAAGFYAAALLLIAVDRGIGKKREQPN